MQLDEPIEKTLGGAVRILPKLKRLGIKTVRDLLLHVPSRYEDFSNISVIAALKPGQTATVQGQILSVAVSRTWKKRMALTQAVVQDKTAAIKAVWFNQPFIAQRLKQGVFVSLSGKVTYNHGSLYLSNPAYEVLKQEAGSRDKTESFDAVRRSASNGDRNQGMSSVHTARLVPVYPETSGLTSRWLRYLMQAALKKIGAVPDPLPPDILERRKLPGLDEALRRIHFPATIAEAAAAKQRLIFDELFLMQLGNLRERLKLSKEKAPAIPPSLAATKQFIEALPFELTLAQKRAAWEILQDLAKPIPMSRLLEGDVGSGKTVVAAIAIRACIEAGWQVAVMAPTEILARQHFATLRKFLPNARIGLALANERRAATQEKINRAEFSAMIQNEEISLIIGTHALIQREIVFPKLALAIIDEQHRFGVEQRAHLVKYAAGSREPRQNEVLSLYDGAEQRRQGAGEQNDPELPATSYLLPHLLSMTATPIPRTLALALYGDLDISILDEMPTGRQKVETRLVPPALRNSAYEFIRAEVAHGRQAFVVCPRIELGIRNKESGGGKNMIHDSQFVIQNNWDEAKAVLVEHEKLSKEVFPDLRVAMLHGKMKSKEKEATMVKFLNRELDVLVSTSVVEVGVDIPNATIMMIEGAEHFGLAQLHQFRGRVGRGVHQSYCLLLTDSPARKTNKRMKALLTAHSGFELAEHDLRIRGPGDFYGMRQAGLADLTMSILSDLGFVREARQEARRLLKTDPSLAGHPKLAEVLGRFWQSVHFE